MVFSGCAGTRAGIASERMTSPDRTVADLRWDLERLVSDLFESDSRGTIPALEIERRDGQLVICAQVPGPAGEDAPIGLELRLASAA